MLHLFANHDVHAQVRAIAGDLAGLERARDLVVVGYGQHIEAAGRRADEVLRRLSPVAPPGVHV